MKNIMSYQKLARLQTEIAQASGTRKQFLESKANAERVKLAAVLTDNKLQFPKRIETCTLCWLHSWVTRAAYDAGLVNRAFCRAQIGL